jgi:hypothetical protein
MKIEFFETDEEGKYISVGIDGRRVIMPTSRTIADLLRIKRGPILQGDPRLTNETDVINPPADKGSNEIERDDYVTFTPIAAGGYTPQERADQMGLLIGSSFQILDVREDGYDIIDRASPTPKRIGVMKFDVTLSKKTPKIQIVKEEVFEMTKDCPNCKDSFGKPLIVALRVDKGSDHYQGQCEECKQIMTAPYPTP